MRATIVKRSELAVRTAGDDERPKAQSSGYVIIKIRNLALVREIHPRSTEYVSHFGVEYPRIGVDRTVDPMLLNEMVPIELRRVVRSMWHRDALLRRHIHGLRLRVRYLKEV